jgi:hypothetical protein
MMGIAIPPSLPTVCGQAGKRPIIPLIHRERHLTETEIGTHCRSASRSWTQSCAAVIALAIRCTAF